MLRTKLLIAFAALAFITVLGGSISLVLMNRLSAAFSVYADVTVPLLRDSAQLIDNARGMRAIASRADDANADVAALRDQMAAIDASSRNELDVLAARSRSAGLDIGIDVARKTEAEFAALLSKIIEAGEAARALSRDVSRRVAAFEEAVRANRAAVETILTRAESGINQKEEEAKIEQQTRRATAGSLGVLISALISDYFPRVVNSGKLSGRLNDLSVMSQLALAQPDDVLLSEIEASGRQILRGMAVVARRLEGRMGDEQGRADFAAVKEYTAKVGTAFDAVISGQRNVLAARNEVMQGRAALDRLDRAYFTVLANVQETTERLNAAARGAAAQGFVWAKNVVIFSGVLALLGALALALWFAHWITRPLTTLTDHAVEIRRTGELSELPPERVAGEYEEIDKLTSSFNAMVAELSEARGRLIDWSESEIRTQYERLNAAIDNMPLGLCMFDRDHKLIICNANYAAIYGIPEQYTRPGTPLKTILNHRLETGAYSDDNELIIAERLTKIAAGKPWYGVNELADGRIIAVSHRPLANGGHVAIHEDITERRQTELKIAHMAHHDALTDLPNRVRFREDMVAGLARVQRGEAMAVLCMDLDHFKDVNDTLGHPVGDALLREVAERLKPCIRGHDSIARLGGDEFAIIQTGANQPESATALAARLIKEVARPFDVEGHQVVVGASVGIAMAPADDTDPDLLLKKADLALYRAKEDGRSTFRFFEPEMDARMQKRRALEIDLRQALPLGQFEVYYQPLVTIDGGQVSGFEALLRWHHPERGMVPPDQFIPLAEEIGLISSIGAWVLKQACAEAAKWRNDIRIAVNLSPVQFKDKTLVLDVIAALGQSGLKPQRLELEITEKVLLQDTDETVATLNQLRALGVRISMDDFGTGYSSLGYLRKFPFDKIKIDRSFIRDLADKPDSIAIVRAVTKLGSTLGIVTTAEGVETEEQLKMLLREGCTEAQGFLFSKPTPAKNVSGVIDRIDDDATRDAQGAEDARTARRTKEVA